MGMSIDIHVYDYFDLVKNITQRVGDSIPEGRSVNDFVERVLPEFGFRAGDKYITLWNEYWSDSGYNSASELFRAVELYFGIDDVFLSNYDYGGNANAEEVLEELDIEPIRVNEDDEDYY